MRFKLIFSIVSYVIMLGGFMMMFPAAADWLDGDGQSASIFALLAALTCSVGLIGWMLADMKPTPLKTKEMFLTTAMIWFSFSVVCALPIYFSPIEISFVDAFFESSSGLTTTGSTIFTNLESLPKGLLLWRSMTQWMGGLGILVLAILVLPVLQIGGMQLFNIEASGESNRDMPMIAQNISGILMYFVIITSLCGICLWLAGMSAFDALNHAMATTSTGGFSTHDLSIGYFKSPIIEWIITFFMFVGGLPLMMGLLIFQRHFETIRNNEQIKLYFWFTLGIILFVAGIRWHDAAFDNTQLSDILRTTAFDIVSVMTSTGFIVDNYERWGGYATMLFFLIMLTGGCTGSTAGGIKMFRFSILFKTIYAQLKKAIQPHGVFVARYGNKPITDNIVNSVLVFLGLYAFSAVVGSLMLSLCGLDFVTASSGAITALSNIGPALGSVIGPDKTFAALSDTAKTILAFLMIIGRLEFIAVFVLTIPFFWKKNI